ncbi:hypothetical protein GCM10009019_13030 [Salarchaeum japonicum]|uniref:Uncharacterized protein n=1 Tax=Salarchaeum japonicum TaxID=555573 RepID=A0AAV3T0D3_9EURY
MFADVALDGDDTGCQSHTRRFAGERFMRPGTQNIMLRTRTAMPNTTPDATTDFGPTRIAFELSESKYRTSPALDIRPPEF